MTGQLHHHLDGESAQPPRVPGSPKAIQVKLIVVDALDNSLFLSCRLFAVNAAD